MTGTDISTFDLLYEHQGGRCAYCGVALRDRRRSPRGEPVPMDAATIDHVRPLRRGRRLSRQDRSLVELSNKVLACRLCNVRKQCQTWAPKIPPPDAERVQRCVEMIRVKRMAAREAAEIAGWGEGGVDAGGGAC